MSLSHGCGIHKKAMKMMMIGVDTEVMVKD